MRFPFFRKKDRAPPEQKSAVMVFGPGAARLMSRQYLTLADEGYSLNPVAKMCVEKIATAVASVELGAYKETKGKLKQLDSHPIMKLLASPNPAQSTKDLIGDLIRYRLIAGNAFLHGTGLEARSKQPPKELYLFRPDCVKVEEGPGILPLGYEYRTKSSKAFYPVDPITGFSAVLHFKSFHPTDPLYGLSPMVAGAYSIDQHNNAAVWNQALLQNGARPSGALVMTGKDGQPLALTEEQRTQLRRQLQDAYTGAKNSGAPLVLEGGMDWKEMSLSPKDMDFNEGKNSAARDIALAFGVPPQLLGIPGDNTYSNYQEARLAFWIETVLPMLGDTLDRLNRWLEFMFPDVYVWYDSDSIPALETLRAERSTRINQTDYLTVDEKRKAMGLDPLPNGIGNVVLVPSSDIPLDLAGQMDLAEPGSEADGKETEEDEEGQAA